MSYGIHPFAVSISAIEAALQTPEKPTGLIASIFGARHKDLIEAMKQRDPQILEDDDDGFDDEDEPTTEQALRDMIAGKELNAYYGHTYAYALKALCEHFGEFQDNSYWSNMRAEWADEVDSAMTAAGIAQETLSIGCHIMYRGAPIDIPPVDDFPSIGYILNTELADAAKAITAADFSVTDEEAKVSIMAIFDWLKRAHALQTDLVFFYH